MADEVSEELEPVAVPETAPEARIDEAENTAETALIIADDLTAQVAELSNAVSALAARISELETSYSNARRDDGISDGSDNGTSTDNPAEETRETTGIPVIKPRREHPYFRRLW